jgi:DNA-binding SARP family transcriptional activator/basic membrane lipoprotein Med (substrate-binding protein (PBP1-ABC) superfamily)
VTNREGVIAFSVLGPLEVRTGETKLPLGGAKQRAVLAALLLRAGEVVSVERLIDEVWGDDPPPSARHSLEAYVSRLRQVLNGHGPALVRRGSGYVLALRGALLDADEFERLAEEAWSAAARGSFEESRRLAHEALGLWRGPALPDVPLASAGRAEAERLEELRLRTFEQLFEAELALGRHEAVVGELQALVRQNPYRERFAAQLMLALYRSGRQADALAVYEQTRRRLDDDLGLTPSAELQQLSGQIVRREPQLLRPPAVPRAVWAIVPERARTMAVLVLAGAVTVAAMALTASGSAPSGVAEATASKRVALVQQAGPDRLYDARTSVAFSTAARGWSLDPEVVTVEPSDLAEMGIEGVSRALEAGRYALVVVVHQGRLANELAPLASRLPETRFVFVDADLAGLGLAGAPNVSAVRFAEEQSSHLAGYLSALTARRRGADQERVARVSVVAGSPTPYLRKVVAEFRRGVHQVSRRVTVRVDYASEEGDPTSCERIANAQIDAGSDVVFAVAGPCGLGAVAVARTRGVWAIGAYGDGLVPDSHVLGITYKDLESAIRRVLWRFVMDDLPAGDETVLGLIDDYAVGIDSVNPLVPAVVWSKVVERCSALRVAAANRT